MQKNEKYSKNEGAFSLQKIQPGFHIEADKIGNAISVSIMGVISILDFSDVCALLKMRKGRIKISGTDLSVAVYENKTVEIIGRIGTVEFL
ncbi:MAG: hypothetical protein E7612_08410 [Ruminococcaceae bacterium]|nr:hypothetical protein [Oscillospiraceae bacterium]